MRKICLIGLFAFVLAATAAAEDLQVNSYTLGNQLYPQIAALDDGFIVVWRSSLFSGDPDDAIVGRRLDSTGQPVSADFQISGVGTESDLREPSVAALGSGAFVVTWIDTSVILRARLFDSAGSAISGVLTLADIARDPDLAAVGASDFAVVWYEGTMSGDAVQVQRYDSTGTAVGAMERADTSSGDLSRTHIASRGSGEFVVTWRSSGVGSVGRLFDSSGSPVAAELDLGTDGSPGPVAMRDDGSFLLTLAANPDVGVGADIKARLFDSLGAPLATEVTVNTFVAGYQGFPEVATKDDGFAVVWRSTASDATDSSGFSVHYRDIGPSAELAGGSFQLNSYTTSDQESPAVAVGGDGQVVVVWSSNGSPGSDAGRAILSTTSFDNIFTDGFESGDTASWSSTLP